MPSEPTNLNAKKFSFASGLRKGYLRHLFPGNASDVAAVSQPNVAYHHFPEEIIILNALHTHGAQFIKTVDAQMGKKVGLLACDKITGTSEYYALPNQSLSNAERYLSEKDMEGYVMGHDLHTPARVSFSSRKSLRESISSVEASDAALAASVRKLERKRDDDISIRSSLSEKQEKYVKRIHKEYKETCDNLREELATALSQHQENEELLAKERDTRTNMEKEYGNNIELFYSSGFQRGLILSEAWHESNPTICAHLFGFHNFNEYKVYCTCLFPELVLSYGKKQHDAITEWEKCSMTKLRMRRGLTHEVIGAIWNRSRCIVGVYINVWAQRWEVAGSNLSDLDLTQAYLDAERPQIFRDAEQENVAVLVDGKDFMIDDPKKNSAMKRACWSDKVHHAAARIITWSTPAGLTIEHSPLYMARATETAIVSICGSYHSTVPLSKVPDIRPPQLCNIRTEKYGESCPLAAVIKENRNRGADNDRGESDSDDDESVDSNDEELEAPHESRDHAPSIDLENRADHFLKKMLDRQSEDKPGKKYSAEAIVEFNKILLRSGPNQSSTTKLDQLKIHQSLHLAYKKGDLRKCLLSYYLNEMEQARLCMMSHLMGEAGDEEPPVLYTRLAKIPVGGTVLADRGFYFDAPSYPNVNGQVTPHFITGRDQFESNEISSDLVTCRLRWSSEAVFSRITDHNALTDVIPFSYFPIMGAMIEWGHAHANLMQPFNNPINY